MNANVCEPHRIVTNGSLAVEREAGGLALRVLHTPRSRAEDGRVIVESGLFLRHRISKLATHGHLPHAIVRVQGSKASASDGDRGTTRSLPLCGEHGNNGRLPVDLKRNLVRTERVISGIIERDRDRELLWIGESRHRAQNIFCIEQNGVGNRECSTSRIEYICVVDIRECWTENGCSAL